MSNKDGGHSLGATHALISTAVLLIVFECKNNNSESCPHLDPLWKWDSNRTIIESVKHSLHTSDKEWQMLPSQFSL